ncbi:MAG: TetR/AcrR family transcriptional regulator [Thermoanaerobaculales bacterium]|jgi:AcrR family transcriptional regulator|nr:TetR/AcrR family transcriptional regulator [Thermoanaerobaculales bacterium]
MSSPAPPTTARGEKRPLILQAATEVFAEQGFAAVTVAEIAERAGIGKGTVYEYFSSKEELLFAVFEWMNEAIFERIRGLLDEGGTARDRLRRLLELGAEFTAEQIDMQAVVLDFWAASRGTRSEERYNRSCLVTFRGYRGVLAEVVRDGQRAGELRAEVDAEAVAIMLLAAMDGLGVQIFFDREIDPRTTVAAFGEVVLAGLEVRR